MAMKLLNLRLPPTMLKKRIRKITEVKENLRHKIQNSAKVKIK